MGSAAQAAMVTVLVTSLAAVLKECVSAVRFVMDSPPLLSFGAFVGYGGRKTENERSRTEKKSQSKGTGVGVGAVQMLEKERAGQREARKRR